MPTYKPKLARMRNGFFASLLLFVIILPACCLTLQADADDLPSRSLRLLNDAPGATTGYTISFTVSTNSTIGSLSVLFCSNSPLPDDSCALPAGLDVTNAGLSSQSGLTGFSLFAAATNQLVLSRSPSLVTPPLPVTLTLDNIINPGSIGPYYLRLAAYSSTNVTGSTVDFGGMAFAIANNLQVNSVVPPYLTFCVGLVIPNFDCASASGDYIDFGNLSPAHSSQADSQMMAATNAPNGYVIQVYGTTMTSGNNIISAMANDAASQPASSQFGINLRANAVPPTGSDPVGSGSGAPTASYNSPNHYQFADSDTIAGSPSADNFRKYTVSYIVNVNAAQPPGVYVSTLTYVSTGSF